MKSTELGMIDRSKLPDFFKDFPDERLKELMEEDVEANMNFDDAMSKILRFDKKR